MDGRGVGSCVMLGLAPSGPSFSISPSVKLSVAGRGGARKGGSCVIISDLVVMAKVDASGPVLLDEEASSSKRFLSAIARDSF
ncbi:hypothetical protein Tco_0309356 [Tanacetum coccineum]